MKITSGNLVGNLSAALNALKLYRDGDYEQALLRLIEVLDAEPNDWQARLLLGTCYYKIREFAAAGRAFLYVYEKCPDEELNRQAFEGWQASRAEIIPNIHSRPHDHSHWNRSTKSVSRPNGQQNQARTRSFLESQNGWYAVGPKLTETDTFFKVRKVTNPQHQV